MSTATVQSQVEAALGTVLDPCSVFNGTRLSIVELGMVDAVEVSEGGDVFVRLFLDDPTCIFFFEINRMLKEAIGAVEGTGEVKVEIKADELWTEERMQPEARDRLNAFRAEQRERHISGTPLPMVGDRR